MKLSHLFILLSMLAIFSWFMKQESKPTIAPSGHKIKVGIIAPFSGFNKGKGESGLKGIKISQQLQPYLDNGDVLDFIIMDDKESPAQSIEALRILVNEHKVAAILMFSGSNSALAVAKVADQYKTPIIALFASHPDITKYSSYVTQLNFDDTFQAAVAALFVRDELLFDRVAIVAQSDNAHYLYLAKEFSTRFKAVQGEVTDTVFLTKNKQDYITMLQLIKSRDPELLYLPLDVSYLFEIDSALAKLGWSPTIMVTDGLMANVKAQTKYSLDLLDGMLAVDTFSFDMNFTPLGKQLLEQTHAMGVKLEEVGTHSGLGMEGYILLIQAMNQCLVAESMQDCINTTIKATKRFEGIKGLISFDVRGKAHRSLVINSIKNEQMDFIVQVY